ncbi:MAG: glycosyltransferase family 2 protein [Prevotellaceae bacterium]|nr:glycosyltransferase family 2 protein [Prevotellaceae bacterium]
MIANSKNIDVSIIIVSYNTCQLTRECIRSVYERTTDISFELIVVDNASADNSAEAIKKEFPNVVVIESVENLGFGKANNIGAEQTTGKYLFLLNSDTILLNNAVKILADFLDDNPTVGICGGNLFDENKSPAHSYFSYLPSIKWELNDLTGGLLGKLLYRKNTQFNHSDRPRKVGYITGADLMIRTSLFKKLNGFDPDFFMYFEETELTYRVKKMGYGVYSVPRAEITHLEGKSPSPSERKLKQILYSRKLYYKKTHTRFSIWVCNSIYYMTAILRCFIFTALRNKPKYNRWKFILKNM